MIQTDENTSVRSAPCRARRIVVGAAVAAGTTMAGAGTTFATGTTPTEEAGAALGDLATDGASFIGTYAVPAAVTALGIGLVLALFVKLGKRVRGMF